MMDSKTYFRWLGSKFRDFDHIDSLVDWGNYDLIVEPFAGAGALTLEIHAHEIDKRHIINNIDPRLVDRLAFVMAEASHSLCVYSRLAGVAEACDGYLHTPRPALPYVLDYYYPDISTEHVATSVGITRQDWRSCLEAHGNNPRALIVFDSMHVDGIDLAVPVKRGPVEDHPTDIVDGAMLVELLQCLRTAKATVVAIANSCLVVESLFADFIACRYDVGDAERALEPPKRILLVGGGMQPPFEKVAAPK